MVTKHAKATKLFAAVLAVLMVLAMSPATAFAATKKVTVKDQSFTTSTATINKRAAKIKARKGTFNLKFRGMSGYVAFTAPKTATYTFTFSNLKFKGKKTGVGFVTTQTVYKSNASYSFSSKVKTQGGRTDTLYLATSGFRSTVKKSAVERYRNSRYAKVKLSKGQKIYLYTDGVYAGMTCKLTIK